MYFYKNIFYIIWANSYIIVGYTSSLLESIYIYYNPLVTCTNKNYLRNVGFIYQRLLIYFYFKRRFHKFNDLIADITRIYEIRLYLYPTINLFFSKKTKKKIQGLFLYKHALLNFNESVLLKLNFEKNVLLFTKIIQYIHKSQYLYNYVNIPGPYDYVFDIRFSQEFFIKQSLSNINNKYLVFSISTNSYYWVDLCKSIYDRNVFVLYKNFFSKKMIINYDDCFDSDFYLNFLIKEFPHRFSIPQKIKIITTYQNFYRKTLKIMDFSLGNFSVMYKQCVNIHNKYIFISKLFKKKFNWPFSIHYFPTDVSLQNSIENLRNYTSFFLRKNKIFNKGRYSRNRQLYRTGVYWCIWLNIICVFGLYYYFYRFTFNFGFVYFPLFIFILSIFGSRLIKYRLYLYKNVQNELFFFELFLQKYLYEYLLPLKNSIKNTVVLAVTGFVIFVCFFFKKLSNYTNFLFFSKKKN